MNDNNAIEVKNVSMHFNMASERVETLKEYFVKVFKHELFYDDFVAVDSVSFEVHKGEVFGIVGTNGSGKSTMLKMISGIMEPTSGTIETKGVIAPLIELGAGFDGELTARENIFLNGAILGYEKEFIEEKFNSIVDFAELWDFLDMPIKNYSSGMVARIAFAIATVVKPDILIVDEILAVGDFLFQQKCEQRIKDLMSEGTTVIIVSHSLNQIESLCDRVLWLEKSKPKMIGKTFDVCNAYRDLQNQKKVIQQKKYQVVASEKCYVCGNNSEFRDEIGMTYKSEAFCAHCGAPIRVSDMVKYYLDRLGVHNKAMVDIQEELKNKKILCTGKNGALSTLLSGCADFRCMQGNFANCCKTLSSDEFYGKLDDNFDLICIEELFLCVEDPIKAIKRLINHLKDDGVMLLTVQLYDGEKTEFGKSAGYYWNGALVQNKWGGKDIVGVLAKNGIKAALYQGHIWYSKDEIIKYGSMKKERSECHPFYFFKFNTCTILIKK